MELCNYSLWFAVHFFMHCVLQKSASCYWNSFSICCTGMIYNCFLYLVLVSVVPVKIHSLILWYYIEGLIIFTMTVVLWIYLIGGNFLLTLESEMWNSNHETVLVGMHFPLCYTLLLFLVLYSSLYFSILFLSSFFHSYWGS